MINNIFLFANQLGIIDWGMILFAVQGTPAGKLPAEKISEYACQELAKGDFDDSQLTEMSELAYCNEITTDTLNYVKTICENKKIDLLNSWRKLTCLALYVSLKELPDNYIYGLIKLNEFWILWGNIPDSPNQIQGVGNMLTPSEYYTEDNYQKLIKKHKKWLSENLKNFN